MVAAPQIFMYIATIYSVTAALIVPAPPCNDDTLGVTIDGI